jgi:SAM-dependent methyltransferase
MVNNRMQQTDHLRDVAYKDTKNLNARIRFWEQYGETGEEAFSKFFDEMVVPENARILDIGCGPSHYWQWGLENDRVASSWSMTLTDLSQGMIDDARKNVAARPDKFAFEIADVCDLQFADETFDVVTANYMLYHARDLDQAISEIARVLKPGGRLYAKTNSENHIVEFLDLQNKLIIDESERKNIGLAHAAFTLENGGAVIGKHFSVVEIQHDNSICEATDPEIVIDYAMSMDANLDEQRLRTTVEAEIKTVGYFKVTRSSGMFIAQK